MSSTPSTEDRVILEALGSSSPQGPPANQNEDPTELVLGRLYTEVMGLIPAELDPVEPPPAVKQRLMEQVRRQGDEVLPAASMPTAPTAVMAPVATHPRFAAPAAQRLAAASQGSGAPRLVQRLLAVAAVVLLAISGWAFYEVFHLRDQLAASQRQVTGLQDERGDVVNALRSMVTEVPGRVDVCPLRPVGDQPDAAGNLVMSKATDSWYVKARGLRSAPGGRYVLWFLDADDHPLQRSVLDTDGGGSVEISRKGLPMGMESAAVTFEAGLGPTSEAPALPSGRRVLYGHRLEMNQI